jgi:hypothetical protein
MTTGEISRQENSITIQGRQEVILSAETTPTRCIEINSSEKLPIIQSRSGLRYVRLKGEISWRTHSNSMGRFAYMSCRNLRKRIHRRTVNPLAAWLDSTTRSNRAAIWADQLKRHLNDSKNFQLPTILLCYLEGMETPTSERASLATTLDMAALPALQRSGFTPEDVDLWAYILTAPTTEEVARRFIACQSRTPTFVLLEILRRPRLSPWSLRSLLVHSYFLTGIRATPLLSDSSPEETDVIPAGQSLPLSSSLENFRALEYETFEIMVCRLIRHARQVWPSALVSISDMVVSYCRRIVGDELHTSLKIYARICKIYNMMLLRLSLPASINPMKSMAYNWQAQRRLLISAAKFRPPLQLDRNTYRAVTRVLLASRKSFEERRYASLMQRTWPPWRKELDGMDVNRSPDEDISRVVAALSRMKEAGYAEEAIDKALKILGGRESDGTPAVQTRQLVKIRGRVLYGARHVPLHQKRENSAVEWAARITATRDVHEAWEAFQGFTRDGQRPSHSMYQAMFEKLISRSLADTLRQSQETLAGDAKEPLPVMDDNISKSEKLRMQPPSVDALFSRMVVDGIRPSGRCLGMLIGNAPSLEKVASYMHHGALPSNSLIELLRKPTEIRPSALASIPHGTFIAFIRFLCRSRHRNLTDPSEKFGRRDSVVHFKLPSDPVIHAFELVRRRQSSPRIVWHVLFRALSQREFVFDDNRDQHGNDVTSWRLLESALGECLRAGIPIDPDGFRYICIGLEKALLASPHVWKSTASHVENGPELVKEIFANLTESAEIGHGLPKLLHRLVGYHLHSYIRVLGRIKDIDEVMVVLKWMVKHQEELTTDAKQSRNGLKLLRRSLIAVRAFFDWSEADEAMGRLKGSMCQLDTWGGWPTDEEVEHYLTYDNISEPLDDRGARERLRKDAT